MIKAGSVRLAFITSVKSSPSSSCNGRFLTMKDRQRKHKKCERAVSHQLEQIDSATSKLQTEMWSTVKSVSEAHPTPPVTLAVQGMNDVLNRQGYTQAAWWNRIPVAAWGLKVF